MINLLIGVAIGWAIAHVPAARWAALGEWLHAKYVAWEAKRAAKAKP